MKGAMRKKWICLRGSLIRFVLTMIILWGGCAAFRLRGVTGCCIEIGVIAATGVAGLGFVIPPLRRYRRRARQLAAAREWMKAMSCT